MTATAIAPLTATELRKRFSETDELVWIPATKEEFWSLIAFPEFRIEYYKNDKVIFRAK